MTWSRAQSRQTAAVLIVSRRVTGRSRPFLASLSIAEPGVAPLVIGSTLMMTPEIRSASGLTRLRAAEPAGPLRSWAWPGPVAAATSAAATLRTVHRRRGRLIGAAPSNQRERRRGDRDGVP